MKKNNAYRCSFCGRGKDEVMILVAGIEGHICENCVEQAQEIILEEMNSGENDSTFYLPETVTPKDINKHLDQYVIGQSEAKKYLAVSVYNHYKPFVSTHKMMLKLKNQTLLWSVVLELERRYWLEALRDF